MNNKKGIGKAKQTLLLYIQTKAPIRIETKKIQLTKSTQRNTLKKSGFNLKFTQETTTTTKFWQKEHYKHN